MRTSAPVGGSSVLLTDEENSVLHSLLGAGCESLASAVVRYFKGENELNWVPKGCGVACCIKDKNYKDYFIRIYDMIRKIPLFEQRLFLEMDYTEVLKHFHVLQSDDGPLGLAFASLEEAKHFAHEVNGRLRSIRAAAVDKSSSNPQTMSTQPIIQGGIYSLNHTKLPDQGIMSIRSKPKPKGKKKLTSKDISSPSNFRHIEHVGYNREANAFDISSQESAIMRSILRAIGREDAMNKPSELKFVYKFACEHGGLEEIQRQLNNSQGDERSIPSGPIPPPRPPPPPVPPSAPRRQNPGYIAPTQSSTMHHPPPPPVPQVAPKPVAPPPPILPAPPLFEVPAPPPPPLISPSSVPPPPPPPPPPCPVEIEKENTLIAPSGQTSGLTVDLQSQIMSFQKSSLRKITPGEGVSRPSVKLSGSSASSSTGANPTTGGRFDLLQSLAQAMEMRRNRMCNNDSDEESDANSASGDIGSDDDWET
ncbi:Neural Wiskott-Aldrich syndrome protein [Schistosoma japonicum]|nr:Neural Wiskott-Aldrich syndrome protein [Schistosoma japonicum]